MPHSADIPRAQLPERVLGQGNGGRPAPSQPSVVARIFWPFGPHTVAPGWRRRRGFVVIAFSVSVVFLLGVMGLSFDIGRMYCARTEAQTFVDSAALDGALRMDGTKAGLQAAITAATSNPDQRKQWQFSTSSFGDVTVQFSTLASSGFKDYAAVPDPPTGYQYIRVTTAVNVPLTLLRVVVRDASSSTVSAAAVAAQIEQTKFSNGIFPFSPMTPNPTATKGSPEADWGFVSGQLYTLQWASEPDLTKPNTVCAGDATQSMLDRFGVDKNQRGFIVAGASASEIKDVIRNGTDDYPIAEGDTLMTGGAKESETKYVDDRAALDTDPTHDYSSYLDSNREPITGNKVRVVNVPVNNGPPNREIVGFAFFLLQSNNAMGGQKPLCAWYIGSGVIGGSTKAVGTGGIYRVALVK